MAVENNPVGASENPAEYDLLSAYELHKEVIRQVASFGLNPKDYTGKKDMETYLKLIIDGRADSVIEYARNTIGGAYADSCENLRNLSYLEMLGGESHARKDRLFEGYWPKAVVAAFGAAMLLAGPVLGALDASHQYDNDIKKIAEENGFDLQNSGFTESQINMFYGAVENLYQDASLSEKDINFLNGFLDSISKQAAQEDSALDINPQMFQEEFLKSSQDIKNLPNSGGQIEWNGDFSFNIQSGGNGKDINQIQSITQECQPTITLRYGQETGYYAVDPDGGTIKYGTFVDKIGPGEYFDPAMQGEPSR